MRIALDAMGGDHAPAVTVDGAVQAARLYGIEVPLVGKPDLIQHALSAYDITGLSLPIIPASEEIEMGEHPANAVREKKDSSLAVGMRALKNKEVDAFVSAGNSGGLLAAALFYLGRIKGIKRPALSSVFPSRSSYGFCYLLDIGANADAKPEYLYQFALMGSAYAEKVLGIPNPRVGIVSNGEEEGKGNILVQETVPLLKNGPFNFIGNVEGKDIPGGLADVVVTDGFTGNVLLKLGEGVATMLVDLLKEKIKASPISMAGALLAKPALRAMAKRLDYREFGGGALLGVDGVVIGAHGRSDALAIRNALRVAKQAVESHVIEAIKSSLPSAKSETDGE
jgi:phosphate acyltransferase